MATLELKYAFDLIDQSNLSPKLTNFQCMNYPSPYSTLYWNVFTVYSGYSGWEKHVLKISKSLLKVFIATRGGSPFHCSQIPAANCLYYILYTTVTRLPYWISNKNKILYLRHTQPSFCCPNLLYYQTRRSLCLH